MSKQQTPNESSGPPPQKKWKSGFQDAIPRTSNASHEHCSTSVNTIVTISHTEQGRRCDTGNFQFHERGSSTLKDSTAPALEPVSPVGPSEPIGIAPPLEDDKGIPHTSKPKQRRNNTTAVSFSW